MFTIKSYVILLTANFWISLSSPLLGLGPGILHGFNSRFQGVHLLLGFFQFRSIFLRYLYQGVKVSRGIRYRHLENLS